MSISTRKSNALAALATSAVILLPASANAFEFTLSGQVNRLIMNVDNGETNGVVSSVTVHGYRSSRQSKVHLERKAVDIPDLGIPG